MNENFLKYTQVKVKNRSGFDKSFRNLYTGKPGTIYPILVDEVVPNTRVNLKMALNAQMAPLATDCYMRAQIKCEAFFVPFRLLYGGFPDWLIGQKQFSAQTSTYLHVSNPILRVATSDFTDAKCGPGTLCDHLGYMFTTSELANIRATAPAVYKDFSIYPFIAYHLLWNDYYRNSQIQNPIFRKGAYGSNQYCYMLPYQSFGAAGESVKAFQTIGDISFPDGSTIYDLRQRNFGIDYFTAATPTAQQGTSTQVASTSVSTTGNTFSISSLRAANSMQQYLERNNLIGFDYAQYLSAHYGANLADGVANKPLYLGRQNFEVYSKGIYANANESGSLSTGNPFQTIGSKYGSVLCAGEGNLISDFTAMEPGYIWVNATLVPHVTYSSGILRQNFHYSQPSSQTDMANSILQNVGNQPIYAEELCGELIKNSSTTVFGYIDRYAEYMTRNDELHGILRDDSSLQAFALQRRLGPTVSINSNFLTIPKAYFDQVMAAPTYMSEYGYWADCFFDYKISSPLQMFCQPSLQDANSEHGHTVTVRRGGTRID